MNPTIPFPISPSLSCSATVPTKSTSSWTARPVSDVPVRAVRKINAQSNHGEQWIKDNLPGITPKIINARSSYNK